MKKLFKILTPFVGRSEKLNLLIKCQMWSNRNNMVILTKIINYLIFSKFKCDISPKAIIKDNIRFPHPLGIIIGDGVVIERDVTIYHNVTLGRYKSDKPDYPTIKRGTIIYANAMIIGNVIIGNQTSIAAFSLVNKDTENNSLYVGIPANKVKID